MTNEPFSYVKAFATPEVRAINTESKEVVHVISTMSTDRAGDVVEPGGADIGNFLRNPVVLADHSYSITSIIGRSERLEIESDKIVSRTKFDDGGLGAEAFRLVKNEMARAWSIGFKPIEHESIKDEKGRIKGFRFKKWELLEYSLVAIPMNADAINEAVARGVVSRDAASVFFRPKAEEMIPAPESAKPDAGEKRLQLLQDLSRRITRAVTFNRF